jgi:hypothetical protein
MHFMKKVEPALLKSVHSPPVSKESTRLMHYGMVIGAIYPKMDPIHSELTHQ